jgi:hypothetical protein
MENKLKEAIKPLYAKLLPLIAYEKPVVPFCVQWGQGYPPAENTGILFVGKATNGWGTVSRDVEVIFEDPEQKVFARDGQMVWVLGQFKAGRTAKNDYNVRDSAFWRVIKNISQKVYGTHWCPKIAWSNIYKIAPAEGGNPDKNLMAQQKEIAHEILLKEIEILSPKFIVFLTSEWEKDFIHKYKQGKSSSLVKTLKWDNGKYQSEVWKVDNRYLICSSHPQGKAEWPHSNAISNFINEVSGKNKEVIAP